MQKLSIVVLILLNHFVFSQNVFFTKVEKTSDNKDKFFYNVEGKNIEGVYLGELEVQGFNNDDAYVFGLIYKKAKEIGANSFSFQPFESITGESSSITPFHYKLSLYYIEESSLPKEENVVYIFSSGRGSYKISYANSVIDLPSRAYIKRELSSGVVTLSTRKFLGSSIKLSSTPNQGVQYFQILGSKIKSNPYGTAGINFKSSDIIMLERSFGGFLTMIYTEHK